MENDLLNRVNEIRSYIQKMIVASENNAKGLRAMKERGFSQEGMLDKVIEVTSIQSEQIKFTATSRTGRSLLGGKTTPILQADGR